MLGFGTEVIEKEEERVGKLLAQIQAEDLVKYGLIPELVGRMPVLLPLDTLDTALAARRAQNALIKQYQYLFELDGAELSFEEDALAAIARLAVERKTGARGLRATLEAALMDIMFDLPSSPDIVSCVVTKDAVTKGAKPLIKKQPKALPTAGKKAAKSKPLQNDAS